MQYILFSKMVKEFSIPRLIETLRYVGADGVDLAVRGEGVPPYAQWGLPWRERRGGDAAREGLQSFSHRRVPRPGASGADWRAAGPRVRHGRRLSIACRDQGFIVGEGRGRKSANGA